MLFATYNAAGVLVSSALTNFNKATDILKEHHRKEYHIAASVKAENFIKIMQKPQKAISSIIDAQSSRQPFQPGYKSSEVYISNHTK